MAFRAICVALLLASLPIAGCGTVANLACPRPDQGGMSPFGGVRQDVDCMKKAANGECGFWPRLRVNSGQLPQVAPMLVAAADLPLSLVGDVVTWPYTEAYLWINQPIPPPPLKPSPPQLPELPDPNVQDKRPPVKPGPEPTLPLPLPTLPAPLGTLPTPP